MGSERKDQARSMTQVDPEEVARRAAQRDPDAFSQLYDEHLNAIYRYVLYKVGDGAVAEEITAEVFSKAWERIDRFEWRNLPFQHWLVRIARNAVVDHYRGRRRATSPIDELRDAAIDEPGLDERVARDQEAAALRAALAHLPDEQRDVLILRFIEGYSHSETAAVLGKSVVAVRQIQVRALRALHKLLEAQEAMRDVSRAAGGFRGIPARRRKPIKEPAR
jgi:RNA polymerase sigma-70 factor (ECF subfamily)